MRVIWRFFALWNRQTFAGDYPVLTVDYDARNLTQPLGVLPGVEAGSRMLSGQRRFLLQLLFWDDGFGAMRFVNGSCFATVL